MTNPQNRAEKNLQGLIPKETDSDDSASREEEVSIFRNSDFDLDACGMLPGQQSTPDQSEALGQGSENLVLLDEGLADMRKPHSSQIPEPTEFRPQPDTPIPTSNLSLNQSVERNDEAQPRDAYHYEEMAPRELVFHGLTELRTEATPSISDNFLFAVEAGGAKARIRKLNDPDFCLEVAYPEGDKVQEIFKVIITERISKELDARFLFSVYQVREKTQDKVFLRIHTLKADVAAVSCYAGSYTVCNDARSFKLRHLWLVSNRRSCCWANESSEFRILGFREDKVRLVVEQDKKETCYSQKCVQLTVQASDILDVDMLPSKKPCVLISTRQQVLVISEKLTNEVYHCTTENENSEVVAARFVSSERAGSNKSYILVVELQCCKLFEVENEGSSFAPQLLQVFVMPREMPDKSVSMTGEDVLVSSKYIVIQRRNDFCAWILRLSDSEERPAVDRQTTISLKGNFKHHTFYCAAVQSEDSSDLVYFHSKDKEWALVHLTGCNRNEIYSKIDRAGDDHEPVLVQDSPWHFDSVAREPAHPKDLGLPDESTPQEPREATPDTLKQESSAEEPPQQEPEEPDSGPEQEDSVASRQKSAQEVEPPQPQETQEPSDSLQKETPDLATLSQFIGSQSHKETGRSHFNDDGIIIPGAQQASREQVDGTECDDMMNTIMSLSKHTSLQNPEPVDIARQNLAVDPNEHSTSREKEQVSSTSPQKDPQEPRPPEGRPFKVKYHHEHQPDPVEPLPEFGSSGRGPLAQEIHSATDRPFTASVPQTPSDLTGGKKADSRASNNKPPANKKPEKTEPIRKQDKPRKHEQVNGSRGYANQDRDTRGKFSRDDKGDEFVPKKIPAKTVEIKKEEPSQSHHASYSPVPVNPSGEFEPKQKPANRSSGGSPKNSQSSAPVLTFEQMQKPFDQRVSIDEVVAAMRSNIGSLLEDLAQHIDSKHRESVLLLKAMEASDSRREERIEDIVKRVVAKYVEEKLINDLKSEFNCLMSNNYNEVFEDVIVPCFENYLGKVFEKVNTILEKGLKFYNERIMIEERKVNLVKDQFGQIASQLLANSKALNKTVQDVGVLSKEIAAGQGKEILKRVANLEEAVEKIAEKQDRMYDLMEKIGNKVRVHEEDKKIDIPSSASIPQAYSAPPQTNNQLLQEVFEQLRNPAPPQISQPHQHYQAFQRPPMPHPSHSYQSHGPSPGLYGGSQPAHADLMTQSLLLDSMGIAGLGQVQYQTPQHLLPQHGHHLGSNGNSVGSSTPNASMRSSVAQPLQQGYSVSSMQPQPISPAHPQVQNTISNEELMRVLQYIQIQKDPRQSFARMDGAGPE